MQELICNAIGDVMCQLNREGSLIGKNTVVSHSNDTTCSVVVQSGPSSCFLLD